MSKVPPDARKGADWMPDESSKCCVRCKKEFTLFTRRHHCYFDGRLLCADCTPSKCVIPVQIGGTSKNEVRVCEECKDWIDQRGSGKYILRGTLLKDFGDSVLGLGSLSNTQIEKLKAVTLLPNEFMNAEEHKRFQKISSIDLKHFESVREIGKMFLCECSSLKSVDLSALTSLSSIGTSFLYQCSALTSVTLPSVSKITSVGDFFLYGCSALQSVDLSCLSNVNSVGDSFLESCPGLTKEKYLDRVDLTPLCGAASIEDSWLQQAVSGKGIVLRGELLKAYEDSVLGFGSLSKTQIEKLKTVTVLPNEFMNAEEHKRFQKISSIDLKHFVSVREVGFRFLFECSSLTSVDLESFSNVTSLGERSFLCRCSSLNTINNMSALSNVTSVGAGFMRECSSLTSVDLSGLTSLSSIGEAFLYKCSALTSVTLPRVSKITSVPDFFLWQCSSLTIIHNMSALSNVTSVGDQFMRECSSLTSLDLQALSNVQSLGKGFLYECSSLTTIHNMSALSNVTSVADHFMRECSSLTSVDLSSLTSLSALGREFLCGCSALTSVTLPSVSKITSVPDFFLLECSSLTTINNMAALSKVTSVGGSFMRECSSLTSLDLQALSNVRRLGGSFLSGCSSLATVSNMGALSNATSIDSHFLYECSCLKSLDLSGLTSLSSIGEEFLAKCSAVTSVTLPSTSKIASVADHFLFQCSSLTTINNISALSNVASVGEHFMQECSSLTSVDLSALTSLSSIGAAFLAKCSAVTSVTLPSVSKITSVGDHFMRECSSLTSVDLNCLSKITSVPDYFLAACSSLTIINNMSALSNVTSVGDHFIQHCLNLTSLDLSSLGKLDSVGKSFLNNSPSLVALDLRPLSNIKNIGAFFLFQCPKLTKKEYLDQVDLTSLLHIADGNIQDGKGEGENCLKKALQRVRAGGANGFNVPIFVVKLRTDLDLGGETVRFLVKERVDEKLLLQLEESDLATVPLVDKKKLLKEIKRRNDALSSSSSPTAAASSSSNSSGVAPAPTNNNSSGVTSAAVERKDDSSSGVAPSPESSSSPTSAQAQEAGSTENRRDRFDFNREFETDQFDVAFDLPVFSPTYTPVHSARDAYAKVIGAIIGNNKKTQMTFTEVHKMLALLQTKTDALLQTVGKQHGQTQDEVFAIVAYSADVSRVNRALGNEHNFYYRLNNALGMRATNDFSNHSPLLDLFCHFITGLRKIPAEKNITVYRAVSKGLSELSKKGAYEKVGTSICWPALTSTSLDPKVSLGFVTKAQNCAALMKIKVSQAYPIVEYSQFPYEKELLVLPNSLVKIDSVRSAVPRTDSEITSLNFSGTLPDTIDVVEMSQQERSSSSELSSLPSSPTSPQQQKSIRDMAATELCSFLETRGVNPKIISILKSETVTGGEFSQANFITENEDLFVSIRKTALQFFKELHAELSSSSLSSGVTSASEGVTEISASAASQ